MRDAEEGDSACMPRVKQGRRGREREKREMRGERVEKREKRKIFLKKTRLYLRMCEFCSNFVANFEKQVWIGVS